MCPRVLVRNASAETLGRKVRTAKRKGDQGNLVLLKVTWEAR